MSEEKEKKSSKMGFLSSSYRPQQGTTSAMSQVWTETLKKEATLYWHATGHEPTEFDLTCNKTSTMGFSASKPVRTPEDYPLDMTLFDRIHKSRAAVENKYCSKCKSDRYFCRHRPEFSDPNPKAVYNTPLTSSMQIGWRQPIDRIDRPAAASKSSTPAPSSSPSPSSPSSSTVTLPVIGCKTRK